MSDPGRIAAEFRAYAQSKLANVLFAYELHRRLSAAGAGLLSVAAHPGWAATEMENRPAGERQRPLEKVAHMLTRHLAAPPAQGAQPILFAATSPQVRGGDYIGPGARSGLRGPPARVRSSQRSHDPELARRLWQASEDMTGVHFSFPPQAPGRRCPDAFAARSARRTGTPPLPNGLFWPASPPGSPRQVRSASPCSPPGTLPAALVGQPERAA